MKYFLYSIRMELSDKTGLLIHMLIVILSSYFIFQYYGAYKGNLENELYKTEYNAKIQFSNSPSMEQLEECTTLNGYKYGVAVSDEYIREGENIYEYSCFAAVVGEMPEIYRLEGGSFEDYSDQNPVYIPYSMSKLKSKSVGDDIDLNGKKYTVAGITGESAAEYVFIPLSELAGDFTVQSMSIIFDAEALSEAEYSKNINSLESIFGGDAFVRADVFDEVIQQKLFTRYIESIFLFLLGAICIVFVYSYILHKRIKHFSICTLCGASKKGIFLIISLGSFIIFTLSFIIAAIFGKVVNIAIFEPIFKYNTYNVEISDFWIFYIITFIIYALVIGFFSIKFLKNTSIGNYRRAE